MKIKTSLLAGILLAGTLLFGTSSAFAIPIDYSCSDCPIRIGPNPETITSTISIGASGIVSDLTVSIDAFHTWNGDLTIWLAHEAVSVQLFDGRGPADYVGGTYGPLAAFAGASLQGDWTLTIRDRYFADAGTLRNWTLTGNYSAVSEPGTLALLGLGLLGLAARRRRSV